MIKTKKLLSVILVLTTLVFFGCSDKANDELTDGGENTNITEEKGEKNYFWENGVADDTIAIIVNKYTKEQYKNIDEPISVILQEDSKNKILIVAADDNTTVEIWSGKYENDKFIDETLEFEMKDIKKNVAIEVQGERSETIPQYKIKFSNSKGKLEYFLSDNLKEGNPDLEYLAIDIKDENTSNTENKVEITAKTFIPNGNYEVKFEASDLISNYNYVKGNGTEYQVVGANGKGPFIEVYSLEDNGLNKVFTKDLTDEEFSNINSINYLDKRENNVKEYLLNNPIVVGTRWDNKEVVEVGENLNLGGLILEGAYVKTWQKTVEGDNETVAVYYYSEGLGCVQHRVLVNGEVVEQSIATEVIKK